MRVRHRRGADVDGREFLAWAFARGLVPWDVPPTTKELPAAGGHGRQRLIGAFRGVLETTERAYVVRQVVLVSAGGARSWWTCAVAEGTDRIASSCEHLDAIELDALVHVLDLAVAPRALRVA